jgi:hypothetical protein
MSEIYEQAMGIEPTSEAWETSNSHELARRERRVDLFLSIPKQAGRFSLGPSLGPSRLGFRGVSRG